MSHRVAILGGGIGGAHLAGYLTVPERFSVGVICDADEQRARALAENAPGAVVIASIDDTIGRDDIDVIDICLPPFLHGEVAAKALAAGKHVICEKPVCGSLAEYDRLAAQATAAGRLLLPVFQYRYSVALQKLAHLIAADVAGRPLVGALETHWNRPVATTTIPGAARSPPSLAAPSPPTPSTCTTC